MSLSVAKDIIEHHLNHKYNVKDIIIDFGGGEPLLAFEVIKDIVDYFHSKKWYNKHCFNITTNGTVLTDEMKKWFAKNLCVYIQPSIDGTKFSHDVNRSNSYDQVKKHIPWFINRNILQGISPSTKMTISPMTLHALAEGVINLHSLGFYEVSANIPYENIWDQAFLADNLDTFAQQLDKLVYFYAENESLKPPHLVNLPINNLLLEKNKEIVPRWCGAGRAMICYSSDGIPYPCHRFLPSCTASEKIYNGTVDLPQILTDKISASNCYKCKFIAICPSCLAHNWEVTGDVDIRTRFHCLFILVQIKASAKLKILKLRQYIKNAKTDERIHRMKVELHHAIEVLNSFNATAKPITNNIQQ